ncbi:MAG TPA: hypothetical protein VN922_22280, partial [Bacteroidia bacterium]|nr:hypothetical protein [Bacteroidia bacterium]
DIQESKMLPKSLVKESEYDNLSEDAKRKASAKGQRHRSGLKVDLEDNLIIEKDVKEYQIRSYDDLSSEFQRMYPRVLQLIPLMYNRLTLVDKLSHKEAMAKIYNDHRHLSGFSKRNIRRNLPLDNATIPRRIRPSWPKNSATECEEVSELSATVQEQDQDAQASSNSEEITTTQPTSYSSNTDPSEKHNNALYSENTELKEAISRQTTFVKADEVSVHEIEFTIPKEKYPNLEVAMQQSKDSVYVVFDKNGILERVTPDIYREKIDQVST